MKKFWVILYEEVVTQRSIDHIVGGLKVWGAVSYTLEEAKKTAACCLERNRTCYIAKVTHHVQRALELKELDGGPEYKESVIEA